MALVYDKLKGSFKEGKPTDEQINQSGIMAKELSSLSGAGPEGHTLAYITPEEEKLLKKATGKETITTAYGIPTYETDLTAEQMEENLRKAGMYDYDNLINQAMDLAKENKNNTDLQKLFDDGKITIQEYDDKLTQRSEDAINLHYADLLRKRHDRLQEIEDANIIKQTGKLIGKGTEKVKSFFTKPEEGESSMEKIVSGTATMDDKYSLYPAMNIMGYEVPGPRALVQEHLVKPLMNYLSKNKEEFNPNKDYHLNKFLIEKQEEMKSKEPYFPPQP